MAYGYQSIPKTLRTPLRNVTKRIHKDKELQVTRLPDYTRAIENPDGSWSASPAEVERLQVYK